MCLSLHISLCSFGAKYPSQKFSHVHITTCEIAFHFNTPSSLLSFTSVSFNSPHRLFLRYSIRPYTGQSPHSLPSINLRCSAWDTRQIFALSTSSGCCLDPSELSSSIGNRIVAVRGEYSSSGTVLDDALNISKHCDESRKHSCLSHIGSLPSNKYGWLSHCNSSAAVHSASYLYENQLKIFLKWITLPMGFTYNYLKANIS